MLSRLFLAIVILMLGGFGVGFLVRPRRFANLIDLRLDSTTAISDVRAVYGGLEIGLAIFLAWCAVDPTRIQVGLGVTAIVFGAVAASRLVGMFLDRPVTSMTVKIFAAEAATAIIAVLLADRHG